ncbi:hypothetical protein Mgra_00004009 [Meloidogyne graminicola]|uniref:K Homology domain-containing protein n=1 Tax=Meloidogyne graminicola TaxID=189291 RepID=A0A8S9ZSI1_9BILA|nr:hypothetical protein Mgra_00004009 [Meloidogyne graminicola]
MNSTTTTTTNSPLSTIKNNSNKNCAFFSSFLCNYPLGKEKLMKLNNNKNFKNKNNSFYSQQNSEINSIKNNSASQTTNEGNKLNENSIENTQQKDNVILTIRLLMQGKDVGSIIGKKGDFVKQIRETSGAKINITDGASPERIVTISGSSTAIDLAFNMIARKFEEDIPNPQIGAQKPPITLRLIIPASQCGSLIGKGGSKIREIRDKTGASLQVANEMLSNSTEKPVTISGNSEALIGCMRHVCHILLESPAKGTTIQYKPLGTNLIASTNNSISLIANTQKDGNLLIKTQNNLNNVFNTQQTFGLLNNYPLLQQQILQQQTQTQKHLIGNNNLLIPQQIALLQQNHLLPLNIQQQQQQQQTAAALLAAASVLNPTFVANNLPNLQDQQSQNIGFYKLPQQESFVLDPVTLTLLANQQQNNTPIDYISLLTGQKQQNTLDSSTINFQQQQMLIQQQHLNNLLFYQQQQSQLQNTIDSSSTNNVNTSARIINIQILNKNSDYFIKIQKFVSLPTDSMVLAAALNSRNTGSNESISTKKKQRDGSVDIFLKETIK